MKKQFICLCLPRSFLPRLWLICLAILAGVGSTWGLIASLQAQSQSPPSFGMITTNGRYLTRYGARFEVRGMNYYPKDYGWDWFWTNYTTTVPSTFTTQIATELNRAQAMGVNTVRVFLPYNIFSNTNQIYLNYLKDFIDNQLQPRNMVAIVTLFDFYADYQEAYSLSDYNASKGHINAIVNALGVTNTSVLAWDIKNELDRDYENFDEANVKAWATEMISYTRQVDSNHLITIGFYGTETFTGTLPCYGSPITNTRIYSPGIAAEFSSTVDFVSMHYFLPERCYEGDLQAIQSQIGNKPIVLEEFGLHTMTSTMMSCNDPHTEEEQAAYYNALLSLSEAHGVAGYLFWTLNDFSHIYNKAEKTHHCQGILRNSLVVTCQVTTTIDYSEKPAADTVRRHYTNSVAYLDLFDSWVDLYDSWVITATDLPPPGWSDNYNLISGTAILRGYNPSNSLWSQDPGKVAFTKVVTGGTSVTGTALSPLLRDINVNQYPILAGQVYSYSVRDSSGFGKHAQLYIGVQEGSQITRLLTITPTVSVPYTFSLDLRRSPTNWSGIHNFNIVFEIIPEPPDNGYSAAYEFDWIALTGTPADLFITKAVSPDPLIVRRAMTYTLTITNMGPETATDVILTDTLPAVVTFGSILSSQGSCSGTNVLTCNLGELVSGVAATIRIVVTPTFGGNVINTAQVVGNEFDSSPANNFAKQSAWVCCPIWLPVIYKK